MTPLPHTRLSRLSHLLAAVRSSLRVLALEQAGSTVTAPAYHLALCAAHFVGLLLVARLAHWPVWTAPLLLLVFGLPQLLRRQWYAEALAPLAWLYVVAGLRLIWVYGLRQPVPAALSYELALALSAAWFALIALRRVGRLGLAGVIAGAAVAGLFAWQLWRLAPAGVTGSDPLAYVQMALDLAQHGTPRHSFALAPLAAGLGLPTLPVTHVGYVLPDNAGWAPTVWPAGYSALLAVAYWLGGERLLLGFNAWVGLASLALTGLLAWRLAAPAPRSMALAVAGLAVLLLATSPEQWVRLAVPLADGATQLFTTAAVILALGMVTEARSSPPVRRPPALSAASPWDAAKQRGTSVVSRHSALTGLALGAAFSVRYTQALLAPGLVLVVLWALRTTRQRWVFALSLVIAGALVAAPDLLYRTRLYGAPWRFGTGELALFNLAAMPGAVRQLAAELLRPAEFGWLWVLALLGVLEAWRRQRLALVLVAAAYVPVVVFHLWYPFLRARDLLFVLAPLAALSALGGAVAAAWLWRRGPAARLAGLALLLVLSAVRVAPLLARAPGFYTFGGLLPDQRLALESLATLTQPNAVIASSLNSGAIELYGNRLTVRPGRILQPDAAWTTDQWLRFAEALRAAGRPLYILMDSPELDQPLAELRALYRVEHVADLYVPVFVHTGGSENHTVPLWRVDW